MQSPDYRRTEYAPSLPYTHRGTAWRRRTPLTARIIDGRSIAADIRKEVARDVAALKAKGIMPGLAAVVVGDDPASQTYVANKERACREVGIYTEIHRIDSSVSQDGLLDMVQSLNNAARVHGILVQLPLPPHIEEHAVIECVRPDKDADGFHPLNIGHLAIGDSQFVPATPFGVMEMLRREGVQLGGKHAVIVGRSNIVGKPIATAWMQGDPVSYPRVTVCHRTDPNLPEVTKQADILVVAVGIPEVITAEMVKPGAIVIDVGINHVEDKSQRRGYKIVGDVDFDAVSQVASAITPVPGGVGPMTVAMLLRNTVSAARAQLENR